MSWFEKPLGKWTKRWYVGLGILFLAFGLFYAPLAVWGATLVLYAKLDEIKAALKSGGL